jgi:Cu+-exporting ATPase
VAGFSSITGKGVRATVDGREVLVGTARLLTDVGLDPGSGKQAAARFAEQGKTPILAAVDGVPAGVLAVADTIKPDSIPALAALQRLNLSTVMITGDNARTAVAIAAQVGIPRVLAEVLPERKAGEVQRLQADGARVGMVGDGINDAPALAAADIGLAIGTGTDVAIEAADITLISGSLAGVVTAIELSRATMRNIRQNLFFALAYNAIGIPIAAGVLYPFLGIRLSPIIAAAAMALSSLSVVGNANRLRRYHPGPLPEAEVADVTPQVEAGSGHSHGAAERSGTQPGHGAPAHHEPDHSHGIPVHASAAHVHAGPGNDGPAGGATVTDPVCGMQVDPTTAAAHRDTPAGTAYFCSAGCAAAYDAEPQRYAATAASTQLGEGSR